MGSCIFFLGFVSPGFVGFFGSLLLLNACNRYPPLEKSHEHCTKAMEARSVQSHEPVSYFHESTEQTHSKTETPHNHRSHHKHRSATVNRTPTSRKLHSPTHGEPMPLKPTPSRATEVHHLGIDLLDPASLHLGTAFLEVFIIPSSAFFLPFLGLHTYMYTVPTCSTSSSSSPSSHSFPSHSSNAGVHPVPAPSGEEIHE
jgi:hypothetical protein